MLLDQRPTGGVDYPRTYQEFRAWFPDDGSCREYLGRLRWPAGFECPRCGSGDAWRTGRGLWMYAECGVKTSATAGTIFHRSHTPLSTWFAAVWFVTASKNGVSARGLQDVLGFNASCRETSLASSWSSTRASSVVEAPGNRAHPATKRRSRSLSSGPPAAGWAGSGSS